MANIENYKVWQKAVEVAGDIIEFTTNNTFISKNFWIKDQIQRSAFSIPSNIAEWADRDSDKEFVRYLYIARWSCTELKTQLKILVLKKFIPENIYNNFESKLSEIHKMINGLIKSIYKK